MNLYETFVSIYIDNFMETLVIGCSGGLYNDIINQNNGIFSEEIFNKFIKFQHGDNDYHYNFSNDDDKKLRKNYNDLAQAFLRFVDSNWYGKKHYIGLVPNLVVNTTESLTRIITARKGGVGYG